jgi:hypothetical protein
MIPARAVARQQAVVSRRRRCLGLRQKIDPFKKFEEMLEVL